MAITKSGGYAIGAMSKRTGVNIETIRYYERIELMPKADRTQGGNRQYNHQQLKRLSFIKRSRELGFSIAEIRELLSMMDSEAVSCGEVHDMTVGHLKSVHEKIASLKKLEVALTEMASQCARGDMPDCPIIETLFEDDERARSSL